MLVLYLLSLSTLSSAGEVDLFFRQPISNERCLAIINGKPGALELAAVYEIQDQRIAREFLGRSYAIHSDPFKQIVLGLFFSHVGGKEKFPLVQGEAGWKVIDETDNVSMQLDPLYEQFLTYLKEKHNQREVVRNVLTAFIEQLQAHPEILVKSRMHLDEENPGPDQISFLLAAFDKKPDSVLEGALVEEISNVIHYHRARVKDIFHTHPADWDMSFKRLSPG